MRLNGGNFARGVPQDMLTDGSQRRRSPIDHLVSGLGLVLVCDSGLPLMAGALTRHPCPCEPPGAGCLVQKGLPSLLSLAQGLPVGTGRLHAPAGPLGPASSSLLGLLGWTRQVPQTCVGINLPFWTLNTVTSCPALASGLSRLVQGSPHFLDPAIPE